MFLDKESLTEQYFPKTVAKFRASYFSGVHTMRTVMLPDGQVMMAAPTPTAASASANTPPVIPLTKVKYKIDFSFDLDH